MSVENYVVNTLVSWKDLSMILCVCFVFWSGFVLLSSAYVSRPSLEKAAPQALFLVLGIIYGITLIMGAKGWEHLALFPVFFKDVFIIANGTNGNFLSSLAHISQVVGTFAAPLSSATDQVKIGVAVVFAGLWFLAFVGYWFFVRFSLIFLYFIGAVITGLIIVGFLFTKTLLKLVHPVFLKNGTYKSICDKLATILTRMRLKIKSFRVHKSTPF